jgi:hypothetical protein
VIQVQIEGTIIRQICRRTFWICFVLNKYTGAAGNLVYMIDVDGIATRLLYSDQAFDKGLNVETYSWAIATTRTANDDENS